MMSAPYSKGFNRYGVVVLSIMRGIPFSWAIPASASISVTFSLGFPIDSAYMAFVLSVIAFLKLPGSPESTNFTFIPKRLRYY